MPLKTSETDIFLLPGFEGSGPDHWQTRWQAKLRTAQSVDVGDLARPQLAHWRAAILAAAAGATRPVVFIAHSLGAVALAHAAGDLPTGKVRGAMLVTPPGEAAIARLPEIDKAFAPYPRAALPFASVFVASRSDPYADYEASVQLALAWGSQLTDAGNAGHINDASGHGPWPEGLMSFAGFLQKL